MSTAPMVSPLRPFLPAWGFTLLAALALEVVLALVLPPAQVAFGGPFVFAVTVVSLVVWTLRALNDPSPSVARHYVSRVGSMSRIES